jgi:hypothetical protein
MDTRSANRSAIRHGEARLLSRGKAICVRHACLAPARTRSYKLANKGLRLLQAQEHPAHRALRGRVNTPSSSSRKAAKAGPLSACRRVRRPGGRRQPLRAPLHRQPETFGYALRPRAGHPAQRSAYLMKLDGSRPGSRFTLERLHWRPSSRKLHGTARFFECGHEGFGAIHLVWRAAGVVEPCAPG